MDDEELINMIKNMEHIARQKGVNYLSKYREDMAYYAVANDNLEVIKKMANLGIEIPDYAQHLYHKIDSEKEIERRNVLDEYRNSN
jgi:phage-related holin